MRKPKTHVLKCWTQYFQAVKAGMKPFEIRLNDRDYRTGDTLVLKEFIPMGEQIGGGQFTGDEIIRNISYMTDWEQKRGYVVIGIPDLREGFTVFEQACIESHNGAAELKGIQMVRDYINDLRINGREYDKDCQQLTGAMRVAQMLGIPGITDERSNEINWERVFPIIENALGFELRTWQKYYLQTGRGMPSGRMNGRTTAYCIRFALTHVKPIKIEDIGKHRDEEHGSQYVRWFHSRFLDVWNMLKEAGLPVVEILRTGAGDSR